MSYSNKTRLFVRDTFESKDFISLHELNFSENERDNVLNTINRIFVSSVGGYVGRFEELLQIPTRTVRSVAVVNRIAGLQVALQLAGVGIWDEVVTQALSCIVTANAIACNGAHLVFFDVDRETPGVISRSRKSLTGKYGDGDRREGRCLNNRIKNKKSACLPMHIFEFPN